MKINLQIEVDKATDASSLIALAQLLKGGKGDYTFVFDEAMPALANVLLCINTILLNTDDLKSRIELQKEIGDPMLLHRVQQMAESLIAHIKPHLSSPT